ncbi:MAG: hypothetical protein ACTTJC_03095 [Campylobacter sp.]
MRIKFCIFLSILILSGCAKDSVKTSDIDSKNSHGLSSILQLPRQIVVSDEKFIKKFELFNKAEYYLQSDKVGFSWKKMLTVNHSKTTLVKQYKNIMKSKLAKSKLGEAIVKLDEISEKETNGYIILAPIRDFDEYEINLILAKQLECGLVDVRYSFKVGKENAAKIEQIANENLNKFLNQAPNIGCK